MATPVGHSLAAYALFRSVVPREHPETVPLLAFCLVMGIAPDLDFLPGLFLGQPARFHQGPSHSLAFAAAAGLLAAILYSLVIDTKRGVLPNFGLFAAAYASHLLIDPFGPDSRPPYGIPLLWPISDSAFLAPVHVFWGVSHVATAAADRQDWIRGILDFHNVAAVLVEVVVVLPFVLLAMYWRQK